LRIAVTGASGRIGGQVVDLLAAGRDHDIVAISRRAAIRTSSPAVRVAVADYDDRSALHAALRDVNALVFISSDGEAWKVLIHHQNVIAAAAEAGVSHIVALSGLDADLDSPFCYAVTYAYTEQLLRESGCRFSIARASIYTEFLMAWLTQARELGQLRLPAAEGRISLVSRHDVAHCLAKLASVPPTGTQHEITGPAALDLPSLTALAARVWDTPIEYVPLTPEEHRIDMARAGEEPWWAYAYSTMFDSIREQRWATVSDQVLRITGTTAASVADVLLRAT
jgi:NAD(P)H dehydrogenase (quinone)